MTGRARRSAMNVLNMVKGKVVVKGEGGELRSERWDDDTRVKNRSVER